MIGLFALVSTELYHIAVQRWFGNLLSSLPHRPRNERWRCNYGMWSGCKQHLSPKLLTCICYTVWNSRLRLQGRVVRAAICQSS